MSAARTLHGMAKNSDRHRGPRVPMQIPKQFAEVARVLAAMENQPTTWFIMSLIAKVAAEKGVECPTLPWLEGIPVPKKKPKQ